MDECSLQGKNCVPCAGGAKPLKGPQLKPYAEQMRGGLFEQLPMTQSLFKAVEQIYRYPLREQAKEKLNRQLRSGVQDDQLAELVANLYDEDKLCLVQEDEADQEPRVICSLGLTPAQEEGSP